MAMDELESLLEEAKFFEAERKFKEAENRYTDYIRYRTAEMEKGKDPAEMEKLALAYNNRGLVRYLQVDFQSAIADFSIALHLDDELAVAHYNRGLVYYRLGSYELSLQDLAESHRLDPDFQSTNDALHQALLDRNAWKAAISSPQNPTEQKISPQ